jgi:hypothetical protein
MLGLEDELLALVSVRLKALPILVLTHLLAALFNQRTHSIPSTSVEKAWRETEDRPLRSVGSRNIANCAS